MNCRSSLITALTCSAFLAPMAYAAAPEPIDFSWRQAKGDFSKDKPGYLILTTEDALLWSRMLPKFVKQKEAMGFHVYVATEKDYGTGKRGNEQAAQVRAWLREFQKRTGAKYALFIGDSSSSSTNLPSPTIPDGEHGGLEPSYCDLDGKWVDLYLNTKEVDTRSAWTQMCAGSILIGKAMKEGGPRQDDIIMSRISYAGTEIGNSAYDLDRILDKTIRYEQDTVAGKNLDWRSHALSIITNYGAGNWDAPLLTSAEKAGGSYEYHSTAGWLGKLPPENVFDGQPANAQLMNQTRRRGLLCTMSHGWNRGGEGVGTQPDIFRNIDDRWPASVGFTACTGFALGDQCNMGQTWIRRGGIFAVGTGWSGNNGCRIPLQTRLLDTRMSVGEAANNMVVQYGDPSLHVLPAKDLPVSSLQIMPALAGHYEERTIRSSESFKPLSQTYSLTNRSKEPMEIKVECDASWIALSSNALTLQPGETAKVEAKSNQKAEHFPAGAYVANLRFVRADGQVMARRLALGLKPIELIAYYNFDELQQGNHFPDLSVPEGFDRDVVSFWLVDKNVVHRQKRVVAGKNPVAGFTHVTTGKAGGALRLDGPKAPFTRDLPGYTQWCGASVSFWFQVDELPTGKNRTTILSAPFALSLDAAGNVAFAQGGAATSLGTIKAKEWHFVQLSSDVANKQGRAILDGGAEVSCVAPNPPAEGLNLGSFLGMVDELRAWSGELSKSETASEWASATAPRVSALAKVEQSPFDDGVLRAPKEMPTAFDLNTSSASLDVSKWLGEAQLTCTLRDAPEWLTFKNGIFSLKAGVDFDAIDFGGYDLVMVLSAKDGRVCEHAFKVRIPVPAVNIRIQRDANNTISFVNAGDRFGKPDRPLAKGVIRYTTDGSPVKETSTAYTAPFKTTGKKLTARFFYLGQYPMAPVTLDSEFGIPRTKWTVVSVSGKSAGTQAAATAFDGRADTVWRNNGSALPQHFAWDLGEERRLTALSVHSNIKDPNGRIKEFVLYHSADGKIWNKLTMGEMANSPNPQKIKLSAPQKIRFLKLEGASLHDGKDMVITELEAYE